MRFTTRLLMGLTISFLLLGSASFAKAGRNDVLVLPARARMIRLGFDIQSLRGVTLVSYSKTDDPIRPLMHVWNRSDRSWTRFEIEQFSHSRLIPPQPQNVYVVGLAGEVPDAILAAASRANRVLPIKSLSVSDILMALEPDMSFSIREWRSLAERHNLELQELNYERRRWGRFGPPGGREAQRPQRQQLEIESVEPVPVRRAPTPIAPRSDLPEEPVVIEKTPAPEPIEQDTLETIIEFDPGEPTPLEPEPAPAAQDAQPEKGASVPSPINEDDEGSEDGLLLDSK